MSVNEESVFVKIPKILKAEVESLQYLTFKGEQVKMYSVQDIAREALLKGIRLILLEREIFKQIMEKEAREGAERIYTSLVTAQANSMSEKASSRMKKRSTRT